MLGLVLWASNALANDVLALRFAYIFEQPNTEPYQLDGQTWYVHTSKGIAISDLAAINLLETTDTYQPLKLEVSLKPRSYERFRQNIVEDGAFPGVVVLSNGEAVGSFPVLQKNLPQTMILPIRDPQTNRTIYQAVSEQL